MCYSPESTPREIPIDVLIEKLNPAGGQNRHQARLDFDIRGSCDGLVCVEVHDSYKVRVFLWNPCTRECVEVKEGNGEDSYSLPMLHGFGYDYNSDDYKVLSVLYQSKTATYKSMIYTLRTNSWRRIQDYPLGASLTEKCATFVSGALYWLVRRILNDVFTKVIISLNLTSEAYMEVPQPDYGTNTRYDQYRVGALEGCLCLLVFNITSRFQKELWVMKEYGVKESWTKYLTIPQPLGCGNLISLSRLIWFLGNDEIVLDLDREMVLYNTKTKSRTYLGIPVCSYYKSHVYVESLVSLNAYNELGSK
ncbi:F-box/kelch-repeat protein At3g06240-like [Rosa rugosa]|uniref:F-box/kelch-repeat protein At3g06240-like n=1 Tax=Rosa rugosa TaxID=74645 RepID=UPI002B40F87E|nr:F-box/kelch-repeat protein At3g06240-like [Rosa rugosa]